MHLWYICDLCIFEKDSYSSTDILLQISPHTHTHTDFDKFIFGLVQDDPRQFDTIITGEGLLIVYILDTNLAMAVTADVIIGYQYNISNLPVQELQL